MTSSAQAADAGPRIRIATEGLGFSWKGSGPQNPHTPERAVSDLCLVDIANYGRVHKFRAPADRMPGSCLLVGPVAKDADGTEYVLCWHRNGMDSVEEQPGRITFAPIMVMRGVGLSGEEWRQRMLAEAQREDHPRWGKTHFWSVKSVTDSRALPHVLTETFGRDGEGWAEVCEWIMQHAESGVTFEPFTGED